MLHACQNAWSSVVSEGGSDQYLAIAMPLQNSKDSLVLLTAAWQVVYPLHSKQAGITKGIQGAHDVCADH